MFNYPIGKYCLFRLHGRLDIGLVCSNEKYIQIYCNIDGQVRTEYNGIKLYLGPDAILGDTFEELKARSL
jgi:hypothetical protein